MGFIGFVAVLGSFQGSWRGPKRFRDLGCSGLEVLSLRVVYIYIYIYICIYIFQYTYVYLYNNGCSRRCSLKEAAVGFGVSRFRISG